MYKPVLEFPPKEALPLENLFTWTNRFLLQPEAFLEQAPIGRHWYCMSHFRFELGPALMQGELLLCPTQKSVKASFVLSDFTHGAVEERCSLEEIALCVTCLDSS